MPVGSEPTKSVLLSLTAVTPLVHGVDFPERCIILTPDSDSIIIGRASKVSTKGYVAGEDNGWFDNPVMSRMHAKIRADFDTMKVEIADLRSLHGTFLNGGERLPVEESRELKDGDILKFGATIWQGTTQFVPTTVRVGVHFLDCDAPRSFQVPDESDEEVEDDGREADSTMKATYGHQPETSSQTMPPSNLEIIDLTDTAPRPEMPNVIDLSSPCGSPTGTGFNITQDNSNEADERPLASEPPVATTSVGEATSTVENALPTSSNDARFGNVHLTWSDLDEESYDGEYQYSEESSSSAAEESYSEQVDDESIPPYSDAESDEHYSDEESELHSPDETGRHEYGVDDELMSNASSYCSPPPPFSDPWSSESEELGDEHRGANSDRVSQQPWDQAFPEIVPLIQSLSGPPVASAPPEITTRNANSCSIELLLNKDQPSTPATADLAVSSSQVSTSSPSSAAANITPALSGAVTLGALTGKMEYFIAREENKYSMSAHKDFTQRAASAVHSLCNVDKDVKESEPQAKNDTELPETHASPGSFAEAMAAYCRHQGNPPRDALMDSPESWYDEAEAPSEAPSLVPAEAPKASPSDQSTMKRKAEDISDVTPEEEDQWTSKVAPVLSPAPSVDGEQKTEPGDKHESAVTQESMEVAKEEQTAPVVTPPTPPAERPAKKARMMRVAERLGYAALGGVTAGAAIFGALVYTAPTFT